MPNILDDLFEGNETKVIKMCDYGYDENDEDFVRCKCCEGFDKTSVTNVEVLHNGK